MLHAGRLSLALVPALLLSSAPAASAPAAAAPVPLSELPAKPARYAQAKGPALSTIRKDERSYSIAPAAGVCLLPDPPRYWIDGDATSDQHWSFVETDDGGTFGAERLVVRGGEAELERVALRIHDGAIEPTARSRIPLRAVATLPGVTVYAYRWASKVFLVARSDFGFVVRSDGGGGLAEGPDCSIALVVLRVRDGASEVAQIRGTVPGTAKPFLVSASVSQTGRDPEPLLAVTARMLER